MTEIRDDHAPADPGDDAIDHLARRAASELRRRAPSDGLVRLERRRRNHERMRVAGATLVVVPLVVLSALAIRAAQRDGDVKLEPASGTDAPIVGVASTVAPTTVAPTTVPVAVPSTQTVNGFTIVDTGVAARNADDPPPDTARDAAVAAASLLTGEQLGVEWRYLINPADPAPSIDLDALAATAPVCAPLVSNSTSLAFPGAVASPLVEWVNNQSKVIVQQTYVFPTTEAASRQMDVIATPDWQICNQAVGDLTGPILDTTVLNATTTGIELLPPSLHGDRTISMAVNSTLTKRFGPYEWRAVVAWVQVGRVVVAVSSDSNTPDSADPVGLVHKALSAVTEATAAALAAA